MKNPRRIIFLALFGAFVVYSGYVYSAGTEMGTTLPPSAQATAGQKLFQEKNCVACHQIYGLGGYMGPDLTNVISDEDKGPVYARTFLSNGSQRMPDFKFNEAEIDNLIAYLQFVDATGKYPLQNPKVNWLGTVEYDTEKND